MVLMLRSGHRVLRVVFEMPRILQLGTNLSGSVENCHFGKSFLFFFSFLFLYIIVIESCFLVVYSFHSPQVLLEFCGFIQLSAVSFCSEFFRVLWSAVFQSGIL